MQSLYCKHIEYIIPQFPGKVKYIIPIYLILIIIFRSGFRLVFDIFCFVMSNCFTSIFKYNAVDTVEFLHKKYGFPQAFGMKNG